MIETQIFIIFFVKSNTIENLDKNGEKNGGLGSGKYVIVLVVQ